MRHGMSSSSYAYKFPHKYIKRYTYLHRGIGITFAIKTENGIPIYTMRLAHRAELTTFAIKTKNGIPI